MYAKISGKWAYLDRAIDSAGETIDFMLSPHRDLIAARLILRRALTTGYGSRPRVIIVDGYPAYRGAVAELKQAGELSRRCRCRTSPYLNNIIEQDHRFIKKRIVASLGFRIGGSSLTNHRRLRGHAVIRKGQIRWVGKRDAVGQREFIHTIFGVAA
jgi:transposase-like protein